LSPPSYVLRDLEKSVSFLFFIVEQYQERQGKDVRNLTTAENLRVPAFPPPGQLRPFSRKAFMNMPFLSFQMIFGRIKAAKVIY
jgi:hypothetical protein